MKSAILDRPGNTKTGATEETATTEGETLGDLDATNTGTAWQTNEILYCLLS
jgi:hypothetical protein